MNIGVAIVFQIGVKLKCWLMVVQSCSYNQNSAILLIYCSDWCGESHTLPYPGYTTAIASYPIEVLSSTYMVLK